MLIFLFPVLIDMRRDDYILNVDAVLEIGDLRNMAVGDEVDDVLGTHRLQHQIGLLLAQLCALSHLV